jgi:dTDP-4-amino-4,6-dideoxygalactose transaminase
VLNEPRHAGRAEILREKGTDRSRFFRGEVDKYTWVDVGSSYLPSEILAAFLLAQLEARERVQARRAAMWQRYAEALAPWAAARGVTLPTVPAGCTHSAHLFYLLLPSAEERAAFIAYLKALAVDAVFHYQPLHLSPMGRRVGRAPGGCPVTEDVSGRLVRLPLSAGLRDDEQDRIIDAVCRF